MARRKNPSGIYVGGETASFNKGLHNLARRHNHPSLSSENRTPSKVFIGRPILDQLVSDNLLTAIEQQAAALKLSKPLMVRLIEKGTPMDPTCAAEITSESTTQDLIRLATSRLDYINALGLASATADLAPFRIAGLQIHTAHSSPNHTRSSPPATSRLQLKLTGDMVSDILSEAQLLRDAFGIKSPDEKDISTEFLYADLGMTFITAKPDERRDLANLLRNNLVNQQISLGPIITTT